MIVTGRERSSRCACSGSHEYVYYHAAEGKTLASIPYKKEMMTL